MTVPVTFVPPGFAATPRDVLTDIDDAIDDWEAGAAQWSPDADGDLDERLAVELACNGSVGRDPEFEEAPGTPALPDVGWSGGADWGYVEEGPRYPRRQVSWARAEGAITADSSAFTFDVMVMPDMAPNTFVIAPAWMAAHAADWHRSTVARWGRSVFALESFVITDEVLTLNLRAPEARHEQVVERVARGAARPLGWRGESPLPDAVLDRALDRLPPPGIPLRDWSYGGVSGGRTWLPGDAVSARRCDSVQARAQAPATGPALPPLDPRSR